MADPTRSISVVLTLVLAGCAVSAPASPTPSPWPKSTEGLSRDEGVDVARGALREAGKDWGVVLAEAGPLAQVRPEWAEQEWGRGLSADLPVWRVVMAGGELSAEVVIDLIDGSVYASTIGVAN